MNDLWMIGGAAFAAQIITNFDNLAMLLALIAGGHRQRAIVGFLLAQTLVVGLCLLLAAGLSQALSSWTGYLGIIPIALGIRGVLLIRASRPEDPPQISAAQGLIATTALFLSLSTDSLVLLSSLFADSVYPYRGIEAIGAALAGVTLAAAGFVISKVIQNRAGGVLARLDRLAPFVMIAAGIYVLANTMSDAI